MRTLILTGLIATGLLYWGQAAGAPEAQMIIDRGGAIASDAFDLSHDLAEALAQRWVGKTDSPMATLIGRR